MEREINLRTDLTRSTTSRDSFEPQDKLIVNPVKDSGKTGGFASYRGKHRSHVKGAGHKAVERNGWMKAYNRASTR